MVSRGEAARLDKTRDARATHRVVRVVNAQPTANMKSTAPPLYTPRHPTWGTLERVDRIEKRRALIPPRELRGGGGGGGGGGSSGGGVASTCGGLSPRPPPRRLTAPSAETGIKVTSR